MKLIRFGEAGKEKPGVILISKCYDVSAWITDYDEAFFENDGLKKVEKSVATTTLPVVDVKRYGCPVKRPSKIVCIGLNYSDHAKETGATLPAEPVIFFKSTTAIIGPNDEVMIPRDSVKTDWEVELVIVCIMISANVNFSSNVVVPGIKEKAAIHLHQSDHGWLQKMKLLMFTTCVYGLP